MLLLLQAYGYDLPKDIEELYSKVGAWDRNTLFFCYTQSHCAVHMNSGVNAAVDRVASM